jgi:hypothetical protein
VAAREPPRLPTGVRTAAAMKASVIASLRFGRAFGDSSSRMLSPLLSSRHTKVNITSLVVLPRI